MPMLEPPPALDLRPPARGAHAKVSLRLADHDAMYAGNAKHYLECGASALSVIHAATVLGGVRVGSVLDFGAGAGRVTRWLRAQWPMARLAATDLRGADLEFCAAEFGCDTWLSGTDIATLAAPRRYDVIWAGSVLTHLAAPVAEALLAKLLSWTRPGGIVVASLHGRRVAARGAAHEFYGLGVARWAALHAEHAAGAPYAYADYPETPGYGISLTHPAWAAGLTERLEGARLVLLGERLWDDHHDVVALRRQETVTGQ
ncbi:MAG: class I SAM-dependent methyltransferase [Acetobacteraceae bacterium]|nr:class I SAM-dependent methyltransferase [Acetobacteraceae bacterium]